MPGAGPWRRVDLVAAERKRAQPERLRLLPARGRQGARTPRWASTQPGRVTREGRQRCVSVPEAQDVAAARRASVTEALPGDRGRGLEPWRARGASASWHAFGTQVPGLAAAQGGKAEAGTRHGGWRRVAPSLMQRAPVPQSTPASEA